jgi:hypothetical protein
MIYSLLALLLVSPWIQAEETELVLKHIFHKGVNYPRVFKRADLDAATLQQQPKYTVSHIPGRFPIYSQRPLTFQSHQQVINHVGVSL